MTLGKNHKFFFLTLAVALLVLLEILPLPATTIPAGRISVSTPTYRPANSFNPSLGHYSYKVSWNGIPAGSVEIELERRDTDFAIRTRAKTARGIDLFYKLRYKSETLLEADTLKTKRSVSVVKTNSKEKTTELEFLPGGEIISTRKDNRGKEKSLKFDPDNFTLDPYSAGFLALSQEWKVGESRRFDMFSGKGRYLIEFSAIDETELEVNGQTRSAIVLTPTIQKLNDTDPDEKEKKLKEARIYISADQPREILKVSSDLLFGSVDTEMVDFTPAPEEAPKMSYEDRVAALVEKYAN